MQTKYNLNEPTNFQIFDNFSTLFSLGCSWNIRSFQFNKEKHFMSSGRNYSSLFLPASVPNQGDKCLRQRRFRDINLSQTIKLLFLWFGLRRKRRERKGPLLFCGHYRRVLGSGVFIYEVNVVGVTRLSENNWDEDEVREVAWIRQLCQLHKSNLMWYFALNWGICCRVVKIETKMNCWCTFSYIKLQPKVIKTSP